MVDHQSQYLIASSQRWGEVGVQRLEDLTGFSFGLVKTAEELEARLSNGDRPDAIFFPHWSSHIPKRIWSKCPCVIFHMTDLPYGRGGSPLQNLIIRKHSTTKLSAILCVEGIDSGPIFLKKNLSLHGTARDVFARCDELIETMIVEIIKTKPEPVPQAGEPVYFKRRTVADGNLRHAGDLSTWFDMIRMLDADAYESAFIQIGNFKLSFDQVSKGTGTLNARVSITEVKESEILSLTDFDEDSLDG